MQTTIFIQAVVNGIMIGGIYALIAVGLTLIFGVMDVVNFAHGEFVMLGMFVTYLLHILLGLDPIVSIIIALPIMFCLGALLQRTLIARVVGLPHESQILLTLGISMLIINLTLLIMGADPHSIKTSYKFSSVQIGPILIMLPRLIAFAVAMIASIMLWLFLSRTELGRGLRAVAEKPEVAILMGINPKKMHWLAFGAGIALAGLAGTVVTPFRYIYPNVGQSYVLIAFVIVVLGGMGNVPGAILGAFVIGVTESLTAQYIALDLSMLGPFIIFILVLLFKPTGILGKGRAY
ncbi:MAG: branched-chain amino acid ABC transporter permease [Deltaproteobacteria bacterium]|nr:branched-chain amino acid ABC transporter permease [Deltaproteobacteria bacterium]